MAADNFPNPDGIKVVSIQIGSNTGLGTSSATYTITNDTTDRAFDADTAADAEIADVLATLIKDLAAQGIISVA